MDPPGSEGVAEPTAPNDDFVGSGRLGAELGLSRPYLLATFECTAEREFVGVFEVAANSQTRSDIAHA